jgi:zinc protease
VTPQAVAAQVQALGILDPTRRLTLTVIPATAPAVTAAEPKLTAKATSSGPPASEPAPPHPPIDLSKPPKLGTMRPLLAPKAARFKNGGIEVLLVQRPGAPLLESVVVIPAGEAQSPAGKSGLASAVAAMLTEGSGERSATQFAGALEDLGATLRAQATLDSTLVSLSVLPDRYKEASELLADAVLRPSFAAPDWQRTRGERLALLARLRDEPRHNAERALLTGLYGDQHPYGRPLLGDETTLGQLQVADLLRFHKAHYGQLTLVVVGDVTPTEAEAQRLSAPLASRLGGSTGWDPPAPAAALPAPQSHRGLILVDRPGAPQSELRVANLAGARLDPERTVADVGNMLLGGMFTSRLNQNLREQHGYSYGAQSMFARQKDSGWFVAQAAVRSDVTAESLTEMLKELGRLRSEPLSPAELQKGQKAEIQHIVAQSERAAGLAQLYAGFVRYGLPLDELLRQGKAAQATTAAQLQRVMRAQVRPEEATVVVVGDLKKLAAKLRAVVGLSAEPAQQRDLDGRLVAPSPSSSAPAPK